jgi:hypothetical protein
MWEKKDPYIALLDQVLDQTMNHGLMWHRYDFYKRKKKYDSMLERIGSITDEVQAAKVGIDRVGANKKKRPHLSDRNIQRIFTFNEEVRTLEEEKAGLKRRAFKERKGIVKAAKKKVKRVRKFCVIMGLSLVVVYERKNTIYAEIVREAYNIDGTVQASSTRFASTRARRATNVLTDEEWPHLVTLIVLLKSGEYLVPNELSDSLNGGWPIKHLS